MEARHSIGLGGQSAPGVGGARCTEVPASAAVSNGWAVRDSCDVRQMSADNIVRPF